MTRSLFVLLMISALALAGRAWLAARADAIAVKPAAPSPATVRTVVLEPETVSPALRYSAAVKEFERVELSFRVGGTVEELHRVTGPDGKSHHIHEGDRIRKGTILAQLDPADYRRDRDLAAEKLAVARAKLAQAESDATLAEAELRRTEQLVRRGSSTAAELDSARARQLSTAAAVAGGRRDVESARIGVEQAEANLSYCTLTSPFEEGTIAERHLDAGERVAAGQKAFVVHDLSSVVIAFGVPDTLVARLSLGQEVDVTTDARPGERFRGIVHKIGSAADPQTRTYAVEVRIDQPKGLRPGMIATVALGREVRAFLLPLTAVAPRQGHTQFDVYRVVEEQGEPVVRRVPIEFEDVIDNRLAVKVGGGGPGALSPGDRVVATGTHRLHDGQQVTVEP